MTEVDGLINQYQALADAHLERYQRAVEETDAAEVSSYMTLLIYQHLETRGYIDTFMAPRYQHAVDILDDARSMVERDLFASVDPDKAHLTLLVIFYAMREVDWVAVAEVILDEIKDRPRKLQHLDGPVVPFPWIATVVLGPDDPAPPREEP
jgi:hypothetical protein